MKFNICKVNKSRDQEKKVKSSFDQGEIELQILDGIIEDKVGDAYEEYDFKHENNHKDKSVSTVINTQNEDDYNHNRSSRITGQILISDSSILSQSRNTSIQPLWKSIGGAKDLKIDVPIGNYESNQSTSRNQLESTRSLLVSQRFDNHLDDERLDNH